MKWYFMRENSGKPLAPKEHKERVGESKLLIFSWLPPRMCCAFKRSDCLLQGPKAASVRMVRNADGARSNVTALRRRSEMILKLGESKAFGIPQMIKFYKDD